MERRDESKRVVLTKTVGELRDLLSDMDNNAEVVVVQTEDLEGRKAEQDWWSTIVDYKYWTGNEEELPTFVGADGCVVEPRPFLELWIEKD